MKRFGVVVALLTSSAGCALAQDVSPEFYRLEMTSSYWLPRIGGNIRSGNSKVYVKDDLGIEQNRVLFAGRLVFRPRRKHEIIVEGIPYRLRGIQDLSRPITYSGKSYLVQDTVSTQADITYVLGGYQYDFIRESSRHLGAGIGVAYVNADATVQSLRTGVQAHESQTLPLPLPGIDFRFDIPGARRVDISGEGRGVGLGDYGKYVGGSVSVGVRVFGGIALVAGYRIVSFDIHHDKTSSSKAASVLFSGPSFAVRFRTPPPH
jgi:hypothetical protein